MAFTRTSKLRYFTQAGKSIQDLEDILSEIVGDVFYVGSGVTDNADNNSHGTDRSAPFATVDYAIGKCVANHGDVIIVLPGHAETLTAKITADIAGVRIIGFGHGNSRPALTVGAAIDGLDITAADVVFEGFRFPTVTNATAIMVNIAAARAKVRNCRFELGANVVDAVTLTAAAEEPEIEDNVVVVSANGPDSWLKFEGVIDKPVVVGNLVLGSDGTNPFDDGVFDFNVVAVTNPVIKDNVFLGGGQTVTVVANGGGVTGAAYGPNVYAGSATNADNVGSLDDIAEALYGTAGIVTFPTAAVPANAVSLAEVIRSIWAALMGTAAGENGITTWPSAAVPANTVSLAEAVRYLVENDFGTLVNTGGTATLGGILGDVANTSVATRLTNILAAVAKPGAFAWGVCDAGMAGSTTVVVSDDLAGYGNDFFNGDFYMQVLLNANAATVAPEDQVRQISDYVSATGTFTTVAFGANVEENDIVLILHESTVMLGRDDNNNVMASTNVAANEDGSIVERLEQLQEAVNVGTGSALPANTSLADFVGKGTGTQLAANESLVDLLYGANGISVMPAAAIPANNVSLAEVVRQLYAALEGTAADQNGVATWPAAAAPANNVSIAEVLKAVYDRQLGDGTDASTNSRLGKRVSRATADIITAGAVPVLTVAGGRVLLTLLIGKVTTQIGAGATNARFQFNPTTGTTNNMCANLDIDADEQGTLYSIDGAPATAMLRSESGSVPNMQYGGIVLDVGQVEFITDVDRTGSISILAFYIPLEDGATLAAA